MEYRKLGRVGVKLDEEILRQVHEVVPPGASI